ncbi:MAG: hypothetical protein AABY64_08835 [Bdellovibrionota bacterium]
MKYAFFLSLSFLSTICFADEKAGMLVYAFEDKNKCNTGDIYQLVFSTVTTVNGVHVVEGTPVTALARKNCRGEVSAAAPIFFRSIALRSSGSMASFAFLGTQNCKQLVLGLR